MNEYVITSPCIGVKDKGCIPVCPVDCIYEVKPENPNQLVNGEKISYEQKGFRPAEIASAAFIFR